MIKALFATSIYPGRHPARGVVDAPVGHVNKLKALTDACVREITLLLYLSE